MGSNWKVLKCDVSSCYMTFRMHINEYNRISAEAEENGEMFGGVICPKHVEQTYNGILDYDLDVPLGEALVYEVSNKKAWRQVMRRYTHVN